MDKRVAVGAGAYYDSSALDMGKFSFYGSPTRGVTLPQLEAETDAVIGELMDKWCAAAELRPRQVASDCGRGLRPG